MRVRQALLVFGLLGSLHSSALTQPGQQVEQIVIGADDLSCPACRIVTEQVVVLGDKDGPGAFFGLPISFQRDSHGRFYVVQQWQDQPPMIFDSNGRFLEKLGRAGDGPGETRFARQILVTEQDSLIVLDREQRRFTFYSPDRKVVRTSMALSGTHRFVRLSDGTLVLNSTIRTPSAVGMPLHVIDQGTPGRILRSFGSDPGALYYESTGHRTIRKLGTARDDNVWAAPEYEYVIEKFSPETGDRISVIRRETDWFPARNPVPAVAPARPDVFLNAVHEDMEGRLWVLVVIPAEDWQRGFEKSGRVIEGYPQYYHRFDILHDTVVEVLDPESGTLVASTTFDSYGLDFMEDGLIGAWIHDEDHIPYLEVIRVELVGR